MKRFSMIIIVENELSYKTYLDYKNLNDRWHESWEKFRFKLSAKFIIILSLLENMQNLERIFINIYHLASKL